MAKKYNLILMFLIIAASFFIVAINEPLTAKALDCPAGQQAVTQGATEICEPNTATDSGIANTAPCDNTAKLFGIIPAWYEYLPVEADASGNCGVNTEGIEPQKVAVLILLAILDILFTIGSVAAVVFVVYGGFMFVTSSGDPAKIVSARKAILNAVIGLIIVILASQIVKFIAKFLSTNI